MHVLPQSMVLPLLKILPEPLPVLVTVSESAMARFAKDARTTPPNNANSEDLDAPMKDSSCLHIISMRHPLSLRQENRARLIRPGLPPRLLEWLTSKGFTPLASAQSSETRCRANITAARSHGLDIATHARRLAGSLTAREEPGHIASVCPAFRRTMVRSVASGL